MWERSWRRKRATGWPGEDERLRGRYGTKVPQMVLEGLQNEAGKGDGPAASLGLRGVRNAAEACQLVRLALHGDRLVQRLDAPALQAEELAAAQAGEPTEEHEAPEPGLRWPRRASSTVGGGEHRPLPLLFDAGATDCARVPADQSVGDGGVQDRPEQAITLGCLVLRETCGLGVPEPDPFRCDLPESGGAEGRVQVPAEEGSVALGGCRCQRTSLDEPVFHPGVRILTEEALPTLGGRSPGPPAPHLRPCDETTWRPRESETSLVRWTPLTR